MSKVAIVGVEGSGKTVLMAALAEMYGQASQHSIYLMPENQAAFSFMTMIPHKMRVERQWPEATAIQSMKSLKWSVRIGQEILAELEMLDYPGELYRLAFGDRKEEEIEGNKSQVHEFLEHLVTADDLIVLFNLKDAMDIGANARNNETVWLTRGIFDYAKKLANIKDQLLLFTQADRYRDTLAREGDAKAVQSKYLPMLSILYPDLECSTVSAVESSGVDQPAPDSAANSGLRQLMMRIVLTSEIGQRAIMLHNSCLEAARDALAVHANMNELQGDVNALRNALDAVGDLENGVIESLYPGSLIDLKKQHESVNAFWSDVAALAHGQSTSTLAKEAAWANLIDKYQSESAFQGTIRNLILYFDWQAKVEEQKRIAREKESKNNRHKLMVGAAVLACIIAYASWDTHRNKIITQLSADTGLDRSICQLALKNEPDAQRQVGGAYYQYSQTSNNLEKAFYWIMKAAKNGNAEAQYGLGVMYAKGHGVAKDDVEAVKWYRKAVDQGNAYAQYCLGLMYAEGRGVAKDDVEAVKWFRKAADQEEANAQFWLGMMHAEGRGVAKNDVEAVKWFRKAVGHGNAYAQYGLGAMYADGRGVEKNDVEAVKWFRKAADQGNADAQFWLGWMYSGGRGVAKDDSEAVKWYRKATEQGNYFAQFWLGAMYADGRGVAKDDVEAVKWYLKAAEKGNAYAQFWLGAMYVEGRGVAKDEIEGLKWIHKAVDQGNAEAQVGLGRLYADGRGVEKNDVEAAKWFRKAADQGDPKAQFWLGVMHAEGRGVAKDDVEAVKWFRKAAEQRLAEAQVGLGRLYTEGRGVAKNDVEAVKWFRKAVDQGNANAQYWLGWLYTEGRGVAKDDVEAVKWFRKAADQEEANAQFWLGWMYESGRGVEKNDVEAFKWIRLAAAQNNAEAQYRLGEMYEQGRIVEMNYLQALHWYRRAESNKYPGAAESRERIERDSGKLEKDLFRKVAEQIEDAKRKTSGTVAP